MLISQDAMKNERDVLQGRVTELEKEVEAVKVEMQQNRDDYDKVSIRSAKAANLADSQALRREHHQGQPNQRFYAYATHRPLSGEE